MKTIGIRREDKNIWERRVPIIPSHVREMAERHGIGFIVQPSPIRAFKEDEYRSAGAKFSEDISKSDIVFAVKEIPTEFFKPGKVYVFFSHTIKGQAHNMPMLKRLMELDCTLIDYEKIVNDKGQRLVFFGHHAGLAGMIDSLWAVGKRLSYEGVKNPFEKIKLAHEYHDLAEAKKDISKVGERIRAEGLVPLVPFVIGIAGYGHVAKGVQEILDCLPVEEITPEELLEGLAPHPFPLPNGERVKGEGGKGGFSDKVIYRVVFKEEHMVEKRGQATFRKSSLSPFPQDYFKHPEKYKGCFEKYVPHLTMLINCIYWDKRYPRLVTKDYLKKLYSGKTPPRLKVIGDISCDVEGSIEATVKCTEPGSPVFVYDVEKDEAVDWTPGFSRGTFPAEAGRPVRGPVILAVDNLPCELPRESSESFSKALENFIPAIANADYLAPFEELALPTEIKKAVIVYRGELTEDFGYLEQYLM